MGVIKVKEAVPYEGYYSDPNGDKFYKDDKGNLYTKQGGGTRFGRPTPEEWFICTQSGEPEYPITRHKIEIEDDETWTDPAGGVHRGDEEDPAAMYENKNNKMENKKLLKETSHEIPSPKFMVNYETPDVVKVIQAIIKEHDGFTCNRISAVGDSQFYNVEITSDLDDEYNDIEARRFIIAQKIHKFRSDFFIELAEFLPVINVNMGNYEYSKNSDKLKFSLVVLMSQTNTRAWVNGEYKKTDKKSMAQALDESFNSKMANILNESPVYVAKPGDELKMGNSLMKIDSVEGPKINVIINKDGTSTPRQYMKQSLELGVNRGTIKYLNPNEPTV